MLILEILFIDTFCSLHWSVSDGIRLWNNFVTHDLYFALVLLPKNILCDTQFLELSFCNSLGIAISAVVYM